MKKLLLIFLAVPTVMLGGWPKVNKAGKPADLIIFRDGSEKMVAMQRVSDNMVTYVEGTKKAAVTNQTPSNEVYMVKYAQRGNVFFNTEGGHTFAYDKKSIKAAVKLPKDATLIYTVDGKEVVAYDVTMDNSLVSYKLAKKKHAASHYLGRSEVFLIKYPDGTKDVLVNLMPPKAEPAALIPEPTPEPEPIVEEKPAPVVEPTPAPEPKKPEPPYNAVITKTDGSRIKAKVIFEDDLNISYKKQSNPKGPTYKLSKSNVKTIDY